MLSPPLNHPAPQDSPKTVRVRELRQGEHLAVAEILQFYASREILLWRTPEDILDHESNFLVAHHGSNIVGCVAWHDYKNHLYEIRSLAVVEAYCGRGIGSQLIKAALAETRKRGAQQVFVLTRKTSFFQTKGFSRASKDQFPQKVWKDCNLCRKRDHCDETAMTFRYS